MIPFETSLKKSKKRRAIASAACEALGSSWLAEGSSGRALGAPGRCWESLGGSAGALGGSLYRQTPDQPPQAAVMFNIMVSKP